MTFQGLQYFRRRHQQQQQQRIFTQILLQIWMTTSTILLRLLLLVVRIYQKFHQLQQIHRFKRNQNHNLLLRTPGITRRVNHPRSMYLQLVQFQPSIAAEVLSKQPLHHPQQ